MAQTGALEGDDHAARDPLRPFLYSRGGAMPFEPGRSCRAPSPGEAGSRPFRASILIAGAPPATHRFLDHPPDPSTILEARLNGS